ncbi:MAG: sporulation transcriptional regulator SpoIIID [Clostridia bacterium]|nr:sporulation transcriptional regulator SpoIIID [Clostridia bacterium]
MKILVESRALELGEYIASSGATVRSAAKKFGISKSTVHKDVSERLKYINPALHSQVKSVLDTNKAQRHIRGGLATRQKYDAVRRCRDRSRSAFSGEVRP